MLVCTVSFGAHCDGVRNCGIALSHRCSAESSLAPLFTESEKKNSLASEGRIGGRRVRSPALPSPAQACCGAPCQHAAAPATVRGGCHRLKRIGSRVGKSLKCRQQHATESAALITRDPGAISHCTPQCIESDGHVSQARVFTFGIIASSGT